MKKTALSLLCSVLLCFLAEPLFSQEQSRKIGYEITIDGMKCSSDSKKLDDLMLTKKGIFSSVANHETGRIKVVVAPFVDLLALRAVIIAAGFEMKEDDLIQTEQQ